MSTYRCKSVENDVATLLASDPTIWETFTEVIET